MKLLYVPKRIKEFNFLSYISSKNSVHYVSIYCVMLNSSTTPEIN